MDRAKGAVAGQLLNGARACVRDGLSAREQEELIERLEALEGVLEEKREKQKRRRLVGSLEKRLEALEGRINPPGSEGVRDWYMSEKRAELIAEIQRLD